MELSDGTRLLDLPTELIQKTLDHLPLTDLKRARLVCSTFAQLGLEKLVRQISVVYRDRDFKRLLWISRRPKIAQCVRSFHYHADIFLAEERYDYWLISRDYLFQENSRSRDSTAELKAYRALWREQLHVSSSQLDLNCLSAFFKSCTRLDTMTVSFGEVFESLQTSFPHASFKELPTIAFDPEVIDEDMQRQTLEVLAYATEEMSQPLRHLQLFGFDANSLTMDAAAMKWLGQLARRLPGLLLHMDMFKELPTTEDDSSVATMADSLRAACVGCTPLDLMFPEATQCAYDPATLCTYVFAQTKWPKLKEFSVVSAAVNMEFVRFLLGSLPALEQLTIDNLTLTQGSWTEFFMLLGGNFQRLRTAKLQMFFHSSQEANADLLFYMESFRELKIACERFLVEGGVCPALDEADKLKDAAYAADMGNIVELEFSSDDDTPSVS